MQIVTDTYPRAGADGSYLESYWHRLSDYDAAHRIVLTDGGPEVDFTDCR
jgi:hypothetical protein